VTRSSNGPYHLNDVVVLTEAPSAGYTFSGWSGDGTGSGTTRTVTITGDMAATVTFTQIQYQVVFATSGSGATSPSGTQTYAEGAVVPISATAGSGYAFSSWSATGSIVIASASSASTTATINGAGTITAAFTQIQYTLTVSTSGQGSVAKVPSQATYASGSSVQLIATPAAGWAFDHWEIDASLTNDANPINIVMDSSHTLKAVFILIQYTLTIGVSGFGTTTPAPGVYTYNNGSPIQITATPAYGWAFDHWVLDGSSAGSVNPTTVTMGGNHTLSAVFTQSQYTLTVSTVGQGTVSKTPDQASYASGSTVQLTATPAAGWSFSGWSGDASGSSSPLTVSMTGNKTVTATFTQNQYTVTASTVGQGTVSKTPSQATYTYGASVQVTATPASGWAFTGWSGDLSGSANPATVTMSGNKAVTATFTQIMYTLTIQSPDGSGSTSPAAGGYSYNQGASAQVTATPSVRWQLDHWVLDGSSAGSANPLTVTMNSAHTLKAVFTQIQYTIIASAGLNGAISPSGNVIVNQGSSQAFTITPYTGYKVSSVLVDGVSMGTVTSYTFSGVQADHTISASFTPVTSNAFIETCDTFDTSKWQYEWNPPTAVNGEWVFNFPANSNKNIVAKTVAANFGYGHYKITFRTSGPRVSGVDYCPFLYLDQRATGGSYNELDIPELFGSHTSTTMSISTFKGTITNSAYRYWNSAINFEDGATHTWEFNYWEKRIEFYVDGQLSFAWDDDPVTPHFANPPMILYLGAYGKGTNTVAWTWYVSQIEYTPSS